MGSALRGLEAAGVMPNGVRHLSERFLAPHTPSALGMTGLVNQRLDFSLPANFVGRGQIPPHSMGGAEPLFHASADGRPFQIIAGQE